ncbi:ATP-grasp domain-containing protein [Arenibacter palladensis]|uniref:ATP-grasp domain-containing protein n=1 Tax=Arenibacter palladensis TaxID=237373 RepID=UPI0026E206B1|nr:ATP-grasp domain-containing protein [Arenibacter palladensis]MDO6605129.1 ATP-grasp domain-containing protein [Arenibacter palladensis]
MTNIWVTGASSLIGYGILKSIRSTKRPYKLIGSTIHEDSIAPAFTDVCVKAPFSGSEGYLDWVIKVIKDNNVDLVIPSFDEDVSFLIDHRKQIELTGAKLVLNNAELVHLCNDKWEFYQTLKSNNCPYVIPSSLSSDFHELERDFGLPLLLKPRQGFASKGIFKVHDQNTFDLHKKEIGKKLMVQPLIGKDDEEFTTGAFCDGSGGYYAIITFRRRLSKEGYTNIAEVFQSKQIEEAVLNICKILKPIGPTNFQFRMHNGVCQLLEINPRFSASTSMRVAFGYNDAKMSIGYFLEGKIPKQPKIKKGKAIRYVEEFIFYS